MKSNEIKSIALRLFAQNGYEGTPLSEIAKEAMIKTPSLYAHFNSKEDLFLSVFEDVIGEHVRHIEKLMDDIESFPLERKLYRILSDACQFYINSEEKISFIKRSIMFPPVFLKEEIQKRFLASEEALSAILRTLFTEGIQQGLIREEKLESLLTSYYCLLDGSFIQIFYYGHHNFDARLESVWRMYWTGIRRGE